MPPLRDGVAASRVGIGDGRFATLLGFLVARFPAVADWPRMHLHYSLEQNGQVIRSGDDEISNMAYQDRVNHYSGGDALRYEKQMMDDWFDKQFGAKRPG